MNPSALKNPSLVSIIILMIATFCCHAVCAESGPQVKTDKDSYEAGETVRVIFDNAPGSSHDWICIAAADARDNDAGDYKYLPGGVSRGELTFDAPAPGKYEVRAYYHYSRNGYVVSARHSFFVADKAPVARPAAVPEMIKPVENQTMESPAETPVPAGSRQYNVAVFYFTPLSVDASSVSVTVTNILANNPQMQSSFAMLGKKDLEIFLSGNNLQQNDQLDNILEIGARLGLNFVIAGNIEKRGASIITHCMVVSMAGKNIIFKKQFTSRSEADLIDHASKMSSAIMNAILRGNE
jgi:TolB-like protein